MRQIRRAVALLMVVLMYSLFPTTSSGNESGCARVKIEIKQELTQERQAFDATMKITNGLTNQCRRIQLLPHKGGLICEFKRGMQCRSN